MLNQHYITRPVDPFSKHGVEISKVFTEEQYTISIRHVGLPGDLVHILDWLTPRLSSVWKNEIPKAQLLDTYQASLTSRDCQSFMVEIRTKRTFRVISEIDIELISRERPLEGWIAQDGDYLIRFIISPRMHKFRSAFVNFIRVFIEYAFQFPGTKRLVTRLDEEFQQANDLLIRAGFDRIDKVQLTGYRVNVYCCTRKSIAERGFHISIEDNEQH